jgi:hypothetical protein
MMTGEQAETTITLSALVTSGVYFYRRLSEGETSTPDSQHIGETAARSLGSGPVLPLGQWLPAAGFTFLVLALLGAASPDIGGAAALLVGTGAFLGNGVAALGDLKTNEPASSTAARNNKAASTLATNQPPTHTEPEVA